MSNLRQNISSMHFVMHDLPAYFMLYYVHYHELCLTCMLYFVYVIHNLVIYFMQCFIY
jgi:hypothetical protein